MLRTRLNPFERALVVDHIDYALRVIRPYRRLFPHFSEDLKSAALAALSAAALKYDGRRRATFKTFAYPRIIVAIRTTIRDLLSSRDQLDPFTILLLVAPGRNVGEELERSEIVARFLEAFREEDRALIRRKFLEGASFEQLARESGIRKTSLRKRLSEVTERLRTAACTCPRRDRSSS